MWEELLDNLMQFLKSEVEGDERINLAVAGFGLAKKNDDRNYRKRGVTSMLLRINPQSLIY